MYRTLIGSSVESGFLPIHYVSAQGYYTLLAIHRKLCVAHGLFEEEILKVMDGAQLDSGRMRDLRQEFERQYEAYRSAFLRVSSNASRDACQIQPGIGKQPISRSLRKQDNAASLVSRGEQSVSAC